MPSLLTARFIPLRSPVLATPNSMTVHKTLEQIYVYDSPIERRGLLPLPCRIGTGLKVLGVSAGRLGFRECPLDFRSMVSHSASPRASGPLAQTSTRNFKLADGRNVAAIGTASVRSEGERFAREGDQGNTGTRR
jgi:hypothetical protein